MLKMKSKGRKFTLLSSIIAAVIFMAGAVLSLCLSLAAPNVAIAAGNERIAMVDLMDRYPVDYVLGPMATKSTNPTHGTPVKDENNNITHILDGRNDIVYVDEAGEIVKDRNGENTNNIHKIPRNQYFNIESYIFTEPNSDLNGNGRTLYGWKPDIVGVSKALDDTSTYISEDGRILNGSNAGKVGIYYLDGNNPWYLTQGHKYALIVPDDVTQVGQSYGGYVENNVAHYSEGNWSAGYHKETTTNANNIKFTDFGNFLSHSDRPANFWQPRERLIGVYFTEKSNLNSIVAGGDLSGDDGTYDRSGNTGLAGNRSQRSYAGKSAFARCDNMRFFIMPSETTGANAVSGVTSIGADAFMYCTQLVDVNIPSSVTNLGKGAFEHGEALLHISIPAGLTNSGNVFKECKKLKDVVDLSGNFSTAFPNTLFNYAGSDDDSKLYVIGGTLNDTGVNGFYLCQNNSGKNIPGLATISGNDKSYMNGSWYALGLAGKTDGSGSTVYTLPDEISDDSLYRTNIEYDYIDTEGRKIKHDIGTTESDADGDGTNDALVIDRYDVAANFAKDTWCSNIIISKAVDVIGDDAFNYSHVRYMETYATFYGTNAFTRNTDYSMTNNNAQWYYIHPSAGGQYVGGENAFGESTNTRYYIFEERTTLSGIFNTTHGVARYLIPVVANIESEDDESVTIDASDMDERFFNDSDYVKDRSLKKGSNRITYTKRLSGFDFNYTKQANGHWISNSAQEDMLKSHNNPTLSHMESTVWYETAYGGRVIRQNGNTVSALYNKDSSTEVNIYTKKIAKPENIRNGTYDGKFKGKYSFGQTYNFGTEEAPDNKTIGEGTDDYIDYFTALGLSDDYSITLTRFLYADGRTNGTDVTAALRNAGNYTFSINLSDKWGVWSEEYLSDEANSGYFSATAEIARKPINFSAIANVPEFVNAANGGAFSLHGSSTPLYYHREGWYESQQSGQQLYATQTVTNAYAYYTGEPISIKLRGENENATEGGASTVAGEDYLISSRNGLKFTDSGQYTAYYAFQVKYITDTTQSNYIFDYGTGENRYDNVYDETAGLRMTGKQDNSFLVAKTWYIVKQENRFVLSNDTSNTYIPVRAGDIYYNDTITVNTPALAYGNAAGKIQFAIAYKPTDATAFTTIKTKSVLASGATGENTLDYYINSSMPAGEYKLNLYGDAVTVTEADGSQKTYLSIEGEYTITVLPRVLDANAVQAIHDEMQRREVTENGEARTTNEYPFEGSGKKLHEPISSVEGALNATLNPQKPTGDNYWTADFNSENPLYFDKAVTIGYNLEGSGNTNYYAYDNMLGQLNAPAEYTLYYSISARNYAIVGGAEAPDRQERGFTLTLYTDVKVADFYAMLLDPTNPYFQNIVYTGGTAHTLVPTSPDFRYDFTDKDYENARSKASVTLTLYKADLARWNMTLPTSGADRVFTQDEIDDAVNHYALSADGKSLIVYYDIVPADNRWEVTPQLPAWSFNGFESNINFITAGLKFAGASYRFALIPSSYTNFASAAYGDASIANAVYFTVDANGQVKGKDAAETAAMVKALNAIKPGDYYLKSYVDGLENAGAIEDYASTYAEFNAKSFTFIAHTGTETDPVYSTLRISLAANDWSTTPNVMRWTWGSYDKTRHTISASSVYPALLPDGYDSFNYGDKLPVITYYITDADGKNLTGDFTSTNGIVSDTIANILKNLPAGTYSLYTSLGATDYYDAIKPSEHVFNIMPSNNTWTTQPNLTGWTYRAFVDGNFRAGVPTFGNAADVQYALYAGDQTAADLTKITAMITFKNLTDIVTGTQTVSQYFKQLGVLADNEVYTLVASLGKTDDYGPLDRRITFRVTKLTNTWETQPALSGWTYNAFSESNFRAGVPTLTESTETVEGASVPAVVRYTITKKDDSTFAAINFTDISSVDLNTLGAGKYVFTATYAGTGNYDALPHTSEFDITPVQNSWSTSPRLTSFAYQGFNERTNFIGGVPLYPETGKSVTYLVIDFTETTPVKPADLAAFMNYSSKKFNAFTAVDPTVVGELNKLGYGSYYFLAYATGADNYSDVFAYAEFNVTGANNTWNDDGIPAITGWTYSNYQGSFTAGDALFGTVVYSVQKLDKNGNAIANSFASVVNAEGITVSLHNVTANALKSYLNLIDADSYELVAEVLEDESEDFGAVSHRVRFTVAKAENSWKDNTPPSVNGWTFGSYRDTLTKSAPAHGKYADNENAVVYTYFKARQDTVSGAWEATGEKVTDIANAGYGTYAMVASVPDDDPNYQPLSYTVIFTVAQYEGHWTVVPEYTLSWDFGVSAAWLQDKNLYKASVDAPADAVIMYSVNGGDYTKSQLIDALRKLPVGIYDITVYVQTEANASYTYENCRMQVTVNRTSFTVTEHSSTGWTWGNDAQKNFTAMQLGKVWQVNQGEGDALIQTDINADIRYQIGLNGSWSDPVAFDKMIEDLYGRPANTYMVRAAVAFDNYEFDFTRSIEVTIRKAKFTWDTDHAPTDAEWFWNDHDDSQKTVVEPIAHGANNVAAGLEFVLNSKTYIYSDLIDFLYGAPADTYEISVNLLTGEEYDYDTANYESFEGSFTVKVKQAVNDWKENKPQNITFKKVWNEDLSPAILQATALFGEVEYVDGNDNSINFNNEIVRTAEQLNNYINSLPSRNEPYVFKTRVTGNGNFTGLDAIVTRIQVSGIGSTWENWQALDAQGLSKTFTYVDGIQFNRDNLVIPVGRTDTTTGGKTTYTISYTDYAGRNATAAPADGIEYTSIDQVYGWLNDASNRVGIAGTYAISAHFVPTSGNYAELDASLSITVNRAKVTWGMTLDKSEYSGNFGSVEVPTPTIDVTGCDVSILLSVLNGTEAVSNPDNLSLTEFVKTLDAGRYTIRYSVENEYNYNGLTEETRNLYISAVPNTWKDVKVSDTETITADEWTNGKEWTFTRGSLDRIAVVFPEPVIGTVSVSFRGTPLDLSTIEGETLVEKLNTYLKGNNFDGKSLPSGRHSLVFAVRGTGNYNGLTSNCTVVINKIGNDWAENKAPKDYNGYGTVDTDNLTVPVTKYEAENNKDLVLFDIVKLGDASYRRMNLTKSDFLKEVVTLSNGTFNVTVRVGGTVSTDLTQALQAALEKYNEDYAEVSGSFTITLAPSANEFTTKIAFADSNVSGWTKGDTISVATFTMPVALFGNDKIVFTVNGTDANGTRVPVETFNAGGYNEDGGKTPAQRAFAAMVEHLKTLHAGTYTITASIAADVNGTYSAPSDTTLLVTVSKVTTAWTLSETELSSYLTKSVEWNANSVYSGLLPTLVLANWTEGKIVYGFGNEVLNGNPESTWEEVIGNRKLSAGTYTFTATVQGDVDHTDLSFRAAITITPVTVSWTNASAINRRVGWTWNDPDNEPLTMPVLGGWEQSNVIYTLTQEGESGNLYQGNVWNFGTNKQSVLEILNARPAGSYLITATVTDNAGNHTPSPLTLEIALTISPVPTAWTDETPENNHRTEWTYKADGAYTVLPGQPLVANWNGVSISYALVKEGAESSLYSGSNWNSLITELKKQTAGTYVITASVTGDTNHTSLSHTQSVVISNEENFWKSTTTGNNETVETVTWTYNGAFGDGEGLNKALVFEPEYDREHLTITLNGRDITSSVSAAEYGGDLNAFLIKNLGATPEGTQHTIVASVAANDGRYTAISRTVNLKINRASNSWRTALNITRRSTEGGSSWQWDDLTITPGESADLLNFAFTAPIPEQGGSVMITVKTKPGSGAGEEMFTFSLTVTNHAVNTNDLFALYNRILSLGVNNYVMTARVEYSENYDALTSDGISFSVTKAQNRWVETPDIDGWNYEGTTVYPSSQARYGAESVEYFYAEVLDTEGTTPNADRTDWVKNLPMAAGDYWLKAYVPASSIGNYDEISGYKKFSIGQGQNSWVDMPGVAPWSWNGYDKDVNLFSGSARSNGEVRFTIYRGLSGDVNGVPNHESLTTADFLPYNDFKEDKDKLTVTPDMLATLQGFILTDKVVSAEVEQLLNALKPGNYVIYATAESGENLGDIFGWQRFAVNYARNEWTSEDGSGAGQTVTPNVISFEHGSFVAADFTAGVAKYGSGSVLYMIKGTDNDGHDVQSAAAGLSAQDIQEFIGNLPAGSYTLRAWIAGASSKEREAGISAQEDTTYPYEEYYTQEAPFSVTFNVTRRNNAWVTDKAPKSDITITYRALQALTDFGTYFPEPAVISDVSDTGSTSSVKYSILNPNYTIRLSGLTYENLLDALQNLKEGNNDIGYGSFIIRSSVDRSCSYNAISTDTPIEITRIKNNFSGLPADNQVLGDWADNEQTTFENFAKIESNEGAVVYSYGRGTYDYDGICEFLKGSDAGVYNVEVYVDPTNEYEGIASVTLQFRIRQAENNWKDTSWTADGSITATNDEQPAAGEDWKWGSEIDWKNPVPLYGNTVNVIIRRNGASNTLHEIYVNYKAGDQGASAISSVERAVKELDAGTYTLTVTAPEENNWKVKSESVSFTIGKAGNSWKVEPYFDGEDNGTPISGTSWTYGASYTPHATTQHNDTVRFAYFEEDGTTQLSSRPVNAGKYVVRFYVDEADCTNYASISKDVRIEIVRALNDRFTDSLDTTDWAWNQYNRLTNLFVATPASGGAVTFTVKDSKGVIVTDGRTSLDNITLEAVNGALVVPERYVALLNGLTQGTYTLQANVGATTNYVNFTATTTFNVREATNTWTTTPSVSPWSLNQWDSTVNAPVAESQYGHPVIKIVSDADKVLYYHSVWNEEKGAYEVLENRLQAAEIGWYTMTAEVPAAAGMYRGNQDDGSLFGSMRFQIYVQGSPDESNYWLDPPAITGWTANMIGNFNTPEGRPARGLVYFEFYNAIWNEGKQQYDRAEEPLGEKDFVTTVNDPDYYQTWYVPVEPGHYFMIAKAVRTGEDVLVSSALEFTIYERTNRFTAEPRIDNVLYLGDKDNWAQPTAEALEGTVSFAYYDRETNQLVGTEIPTKPGKYWLEATATAAFCSPLPPVRVAFSVEYSPNSWVKAPSIEGWSLEVGPNDPTAQAAVGTEYIEYFYAKADNPTKWEKVKPTEEGDYLLHAELRIVGYETLISENYAFTVEPAYDVTLLTVDIVLGCLVAIFTVVVIIFAVRRYREC